MNSDVINDPEFWPHRYDPSRDQVHYIRASREDHRQAVFLTDEYLRGAQSPQTINRPEAGKTVKPAPLHFIFHSAYCCSTLLARACDIPNIAMGLKEPVILNDIAGWILRGATREQVKPVLDDLLNILSRPFNTNEIVVAKPSNVINFLAPEILQLRPNANAIFLYTPLEDFLASIARKGMWGRLWARDLLVKQLRTGMIDLGLQGDDYLGLTDLQAAATGWLAQHALFNRLLHTLGEDRIIALNSQELLSHPNISLEQIYKHFHMNVTREQINELINGPVFSNHSKTREKFDTATRDHDRLSGIETHADEIQKVSYWAKAVAKNSKTPLTLRSF